jgi:hypothetical protein
VERDEARHAVFRDLMDRLWGARARLNCIQRTIHHCDSGAGDDDVNFAGMALADVMKELSKVHDDLDSFEATYARKVRVREVQS